MAELPWLDRDVAIEKINSLRGLNLRPLAEHYNVTIFKVEGGFNKGWVGHTLEAYLGLPRNSLRTGDFIDANGPWELKTVSLRWKGERWVPKETVAITMISPREPLPGFYTSHLYNKIKRLALIGRTFVNREETDAEVVLARPFDIDDPQNRALLEEIKADYEEVRNWLSKEGGYAQLRGHMGKWIQPRTKGTGHGSTSRAFYARKALVAYWLKLDLPL